MPNIKSQKDRVVQAAAEQAHNKAIKTNLKTVVKKANAAIDAKAADKDATVLAAVSAIDRQTKAVHDWFDTIDEQSSPRHVTGRRAFVVSAGFSSRPSGPQSGAGR